ncbi:MAG TPA: flippase [Candidatus Dormibacteraeota bacterium]|nr:flippase [Candidatus Dormibacteraeota bacterium]
MIRNIAALFGGNMASWVASLVFWIVVPRLIGPNGWGEFNLGIAVSGVVFAIASLGITTFLVKEISRDRGRAPEYVGTGLSTHLILVTFGLAAITMFTFIARYPEHTRIVVLLVSLITAFGFVVSPAFFALQATERIKLAAVLHNGRQALGNLLVAGVGLAAGLNVEVLVAVLLVCNLVASLLQVGVTARLVGIRFRFNAALSRWMVIGGLPFWTNSVLLTFYIWIDTVLLSILVSTREVGYYAAPVQILSTLAFLPAIITFAIFPAMSSNFRVDFDRVRRLTRTSLAALLTLGIPLSIGTALTGPDLIRHIFGPAFEPAAPAMVILALALVPGYIAVLSFYVLAAVDRQSSWAYVLGVTAVVNPLINLVAIPLAQSRFGHGSIGAAAALLVTDWGICVAGFALMPRECLRPVGPLMSITGRVLIATATMSVPVWFVRNMFPVIPIGLGIVVFMAAAFALRIYRSEGFAEAWVPLRARLSARFRRPVEVPAA